MHDGNDHVEDKHLHSINSDLQQDALVNSEIQPLTGSHGLNVYTTCVFIVGIIAGTGFLTLPKAVEDAGPVGFLLLAGFCVGAAYTGNLLGKCWMIVREEQPELKEKRVGDPYPTIAEAAFGKPARYLISFSIFCTMFGGTVVYVLIAAENIRELLPAGNMSICYLVLMIGGALTPLTWLGTPKDFWGIAAAATIVTGTASIILFIDVLITTKSHDVIHTDVGIVSFFTGYGTICFGFNGHAAFPTFQADMKEPSKFGRSILLGYIIVLFMYLPSTVAGYALFGEALHPNVIVDMAGGPAKTVVSILMTSHLLFGAVIALNPPSQEIEDLLKIPKHFTWKRLVSRTSLMAAVIFVAESVPHFSSILALVGASTVSILAVICPPIFYMKLTTSTTIPHMRKEIPLHMKVFYIEIMLIGIVAGVAATYSAITDLAENHFTVPCYVDPNKATK